MRSKEPAQTITAASPAAASTVVHTALFKGDMLRKAEKLVIDAAIVGGTGGALDVYLQRKIAADTWRDWIHFPQVAALTSKKYSLAITGEGASIVETGGGSDAAPGVALAANTAINIIPGDDVRIVMVAGVGTSDAGSVAITLTPYTERKG